MYQNLVYLRWSKADASHCFNPVFGLKKNNLPADFNLFIVISHL